MRVIMLETSRQTQKLRDDINNYSTLFNTDLLYSTYFSALIGLMPYIDWFMVVITLISCGSMLLESPWPTTGENLVMNNVYLQVRS